MVAKWGKQLFSGLFFLFLLVHTFAQEQNYFVVIGRLTADGAKIDGATINIVKNDASSEIVTPQRNGRFRFEFEYNNEYQLTFQKDGFFKKIVIVSSHVPQKVMERDSKFPPLTFMVNLFQELPGIDKSFTNKPVGRVFYDADIDNFDTETFFSDIQIEETIEEAIAQNSGLLREERKIQRAREQELAEREKDYDKTIKNGDELYQKKAFEEALEKYKYAESLFPDRPYPQDRIAELEDLIAALQLAEQNRQEQQAQYQAAIDQADAAFAGTEYNRARQLYETALQIIPNDEYATGQIAEINLKLQQQEFDQQYAQTIERADASFANEQFEEAKSTYNEAIALKPGEQYPKDQIQKIDQELDRLADLAERERQYELAMQQGETAFRQEQYPNALEAYQTALTFKENDPLARNRILEAESIIRMRETKSNYDQQIVQADQAFQAEEWLNAKSLYEQALALIPDETYPKQQISQIEQIIARNNQFEELISQAQQAFGTEDYKQSKTYYQQALVIRNDPVIQTRVAEIDQILAQKELDENYNNFITQADQRFQAEVYENARELYQQALSYLPNETYPQTQIETIDQILREREQQLQLDEDYNQTIARADQAFQNEQYQDARLIYSEAAVLKPEQTYPTDRIRRIDDILEEQIRLAQLEGAFNAAIQQAQTAFDAEDYLTAKGHYESALALKPEASEVTARIAGIDRILQQIEEERIREEERQRALAEARDKTYQDAMDNGNKLLDQQEFDQARDAFRLAKETKPDESLPDEMIARTDQLQAEYEQQLAEERAREQARLQALQAEKTKTYNLAVQRGDSLFESRNYELARIQFETAISIMPDEEYPKRQIERLNEILDRQEQERLLEENYLASIQTADSLFNLNELQASKENYQEALGLKPAENYPKDRIQQIDLALAELAREKARLDEIQIAYDEAVQKADQAFDGKNYTMAKVSYNEALSLKPEENYPQEQINRIDELLIQEKEAAYQQTITKADGLFNEENYNDAGLAYSDALKVKPNDEYATNQMELIQQRLDQQAREKLARQELERSYQDKMDLANTAFENNQYESAKGHYQAALDIKPEELVPTQQITRIDSILVELQRQEELDQLYSQAVQDAQEAFTQNQLPEAIGFYQKAAALKPEEQLPPQRISEIRAMIEQQEEIERLAELEEEQRLARLKAEQEEYNAAISSADKAFTTAQYREARQFYNQALNVKPDEVYPKNRIQEIDGIVEAQAQSERERKQQAYLDSLRTVQQVAFNLKLEQGDGFMQEMEYEQAITAYQEAIQILPDKSNEVNLKINDARDQIRILQEQQQNYNQTIVLADQYFNDDDLQNALISYQEALNYKPDENYPKERIRSIQMTIQTRDANYAEAIRQGDELFVAENWFNAKDKYNEALLIKGDETYPAEQIAWIDQRIKEQQDAERTQQQTEESYRQTIARGEEALDKEQLTAARTHFEFAKELKPNETYPDEKIAEIDDLISRRDQDAERARQQRLIDDRYRQAISMADNSFKQERYEPARNQYNQALDIKPEEEYPKGQIALIDQLIAEQLNRTPDLEPVVVTTPVDDPPKSSEPIRENETEYDQNIRLADEAYERQDYVVAKFYYQKAMKNDPEKEYPVMRNAEITQLINQLMEASELAKYREAIQKADEAFTVKKYNIARFYYYESLEVKSWEQYPKDRIEEIRLLTNSSLSQKEEQIYRDLITKADEAYYKKELAVARSYYQQALGIKNNERYPKIKLLDIEKLVEQDLRDEVNQNYRDTIEEGDRAMADNNLSIARFYYTKALGIKPNEAYPKEQLEKIKQLLKEED